MLSSTALPKAPRSWFFPLMGLLPKGAKRLKLAVMVGSVSGSSDSSWGQSGEEGTGAEGGPLPCPRPAAVPVSAAS